MGLGSEVSASLSVPSASSQAGGKEQEEGLASVGDVLACQGRLAQEGAGGHMAGSRSGGGSGGSSQHSAGSVGSSQQSVVGKEAAAPAPAVGLGLHSHQHHQQFHPSQGGSSTTSSQ